MSRKLCIWCHLLVACLSGTWVDPGSFLGHQVALAYHLASLGFAILDWSELSILSGKSQSFQKTYKFSLKPYLGRYFSHHPFTGLVRGILSLLSSVTLVSSSATFPTPPAWWCGTVLPLYHLYKVACFPPPLFGSRDSLGGSSRRSSWH